jgi:hydrogenase maturation protease
MGTRAATLVLGVGNLLLGDEGVGVHVAQRLIAAGPLAPGTEVMDGGTGGFGLLDALTDCTRAIIVDAALDGRPPGTVTLRRPRTAAHFPTVLGAHDIGLRALLEAAELLGRLPRLLLCTVSVAAPFATGLVLSPAVAASVPRVETIVRELASRPRAWNRIPVPRAETPGRLQAVSVHPGG